MTETKYPFCEQAGLFHMNRVGEVVFNTTKFFAASEKQLTAEKTEQIEAAWKIQEALNKKQLAEALV